MAQDIIVGISPPLPRLLALAGPVRGPWMRFNRFRHLGTPCRLDRISGALLEAGNSWDRL
jgi:hypothetical protein